MGKLSGSLIEASRRRGISAIFEGKTGLFAVLAVLAAAGLFASY